MEETQLATAAEKLSPLAYFSTAIVLYNIAVVGSLAAMAGYFLPQQIHGAIDLAAALVMIFLTRPAFGGAHGGASARRRPTLFDGALIAATLVASGYIAFFFDEVLDYSLYGFLDTKGVIIALLLCLPLVEAVRRSTGWTLPIIVVTLVLMTLFQAYLPGLLYGRGYDYDRLLYAAFVGESGIFGLPLNVAANMILVFLLFGALMEVSGAGRWFLQLALTVTGASRGGPAKAAVVGSALFGSISGSPSANAATIGVITIPMMKQIGYSTAFAGAVEAVASTGGQILPPVMGAIAFVMAAWIGRSYAEVAFAAAVPACLYFLIVFVSVHLQARREGLEALPRDQLPRIGPVMREGWFYLIPMGALVYFLLIAAYPPGMAGVLTIPFVIGASFLSKDKAHRLTPANLVRACHRAVRGWITIAAITGFVGIMIGAIELSGLAVKFSGFILDLSGGNLILTLIMVGASSFVLGMGLDAIPVYVTLATLMGPALIQLGVSPMAAHLFVVYWGLASFFTPPLCIAVYVTTAISGGKLWETGWEAVRLGIAAFVVPFAFVLDDGLLLEGSVDHIAWAIFTALIGSVLLAAAVRGFALTPIGPVRRLLVGIGGLLLIGPGLYPPLAGAALAAVALATRSLPRIETSGGTA